MEHRDIKKYLENFESRKTRTIVIVDFGNVEMTVDLIREKDNYDTIIIFSGDGDLMYAIRYLNENFGKHCMVFGARNHIGREVFDAKTEGVLEDVLYAEDFEYRLNKDRFKP